MPRISTFSFLRVLALAAALSAPAVHAFNHTTTVAPKALGPLNVACSNIEQDTSKLAPGAAPSDYWEGFPVNGVDHYVTEILAHPGAPFQYEAPVPDQRSLYPDHAGDNVTFVALVCYPTPGTNADANYTLPGTGDVVPHMALPGAAPKLVSALEYQERMFHLHTDPVILAPQPLPVIVFSHGLTGSPISDGYIQAITTLASQGFMVAAPFHGDPRFSRVRIQTLSDVAFLLTNFDRVAQMELMRPLSLKVMLDKLLADPGYAPGIDASRIGGFGASLGGEAMAALLGAKLSTSVDANTCSEPIHDPRVRAAVGYVPFAGYSFLPAFCNGQSGAKGVDKPYLAISGTADTTAPLGMANEAVDQFQSSRFMVEFINGQHELRPEDATTLMFWTVTFLDAYLDVAADPTAMGRFILMDQVQGGGRENHMILDVHVPLANSDGDADVLEFHNTILDHYFVAAGTDEIASIQAGNAGPGWQLTGESFKAWLTMPGPQFAAVPVCRFYGGLSGGPNSHFFTAEPGECDQVKRDGGWFYEGTGFFIRRVDASGNCPLGYLAVERAYNNGFPRNDSNHRFSTSDSTMRSMADKGWAVEGNVMCARP